MLTIVFYFICLLFCARAFAGLLRGIWISIKGVPAGAKGLGYKGKSLGERIVWFVCPWMKPSKK